MNDNSRDPSSPRPHRRLWWVVGGSLLGAAAVCALLLAPPVQGWVLRRFLASSQSTWKLEFDRVGAGPRGLDARGLRFDMPGITASSAPIAIRVAPTRLLSKRELTIERVEARKIRIVITPAAFGVPPSSTATPTQPNSANAPASSTSSSTPRPDAAPTAKTDVQPAEPFDGVLRLIQVPLPWALDAAQVDGEIVVRDGDTSQLKGTFSVRGGGISAGSPGTFDYEVALDSAILPPGPNRQLMSKGTLRVTQDADHGIARVAVEGDLRLPTYGRFAPPVGRVAWVIDSTPEGETYAADFSLGQPSASATLSLRSKLIAATSVLTGEIKVHADQSIARSLLGEALPTATADGTLGFTLNVDTGDLAATATGDFSARDWQKLMPQLAALDAFRGHLVAALSRKGDKLQLESFSADVRGETTRAELSVTTRGPVDLGALPHGTIGNVRVAHLPLAWANPFLADTGLQVALGEFSTTWAINADQHALALEPMAPSEVAPISLLGANASGMPTWVLCFEPHVLASTDRLDLHLAKFVATSSAGDQVNAHFDAGYDLRSAAASTRGTIRAASPALFAAGVGHAPYQFRGTWDLEWDGRDKLKLRALSLGIVGSDRQRWATIELEHPFDLDLAHLTLANAAAQAAAGESAALIRFHFDDLPLDGLSALAGGKLNGRLARGESVLNASAAGALTVRTLQPWRFEGVSFSPTSAAAPGSGPTPTGTSMKALEFSGEFSPSAALAPDHVEAAVEKIRVQTTVGHGVTGEISSAVTPSKRELSALVSLDAEIPAPPVGPGPLTASLRAKFHNMTMRIMGADAFDLRVRDRERELVSVTAPQPFLFGISDSHMVVLSTLSPLSVKTAAIPLRWLEPIVGAGVVDGTLQPAEFTLASAINRYQVRAVTPVQVTGFSARLPSRAPVEGATLTCNPGLDLTFICVVQPKFQMAYVGVAHLTETGVDFGSKKFADLDLALGFKGDDKKVIPDQIDFSGRVDFAALANARSWGLPERGTVVTRINGELLSSTPIESWTRVEGIPSADGKGDVPALELTLRGKVTDTIFSGGVEMLFASQPRASDLKFGVEMNLLEGALNITSTVRSQVLDGAALLRLARAIPATTSAPVAKTVVKPVVTPAASTETTSERWTHLASKPGDGHGPLPFWGELTGSFDLEIGSLEFAPYRIDHVRGRLDADRSSLVLHDLGGDMFAGRWGGEVRIDHASDDRKGEHTLTGGFHIAQFESARVVQTVFPNEMASVDARINVDARVESRGRSFVELVDNSAASFWVNGSHGVVHLTVPKSDLISTAAVFGGTVLLSPELRALGRLLKKFSEMPFEEIRIEAHRDAAGEVSLDAFHFASPQMKLEGHGRVASEPGEPLMNRPLQLSLQLGAKDELAVILGGMSLLEKKPQPDGFRNMRQPFAIGGRAGAPDTAPLYDLLATAVSGSKGTWGFLMRRVEKEVGKTRAMETAK